MNYKGIRINMRIRSKRQVIKISKLQHVRSYVISVGMTSVAIY
jgi:hypothetical protein